MPAPDLDPALVAVAEHLADLARPIARQYFRMPAGVEFKDDASPVTLADRGIEAAMREYLAETRPDDGIYGEEFGQERLDAEWVWVIDPIDGTKAFISGMPSFGTLIGLCRGGEPVLGIIDQPISGERWRGVVGQGATLNGKEVRVRSCPDIGNAIMHTTSPDMFRQEDGTMEAFNRLRGRTRYSLFGTDCYAYGLLSSGHVDLICEASLKPFDLMAPAAVVIAAGGRITDWTGAPLLLTCDDWVLASGDAATHAQGLEVLNGG